MRTTRPRGFTRRPRCKTQAEHERTRRRRGPALLRGLDGRRPSAACSQEVDPDVEAQPILGLLYERPTYRGHSGISRWFEEIEDLWDGFEAHVEATHRVDGAVSACSASSRTPAAAPPTRGSRVVCTFRDGKILSFRGRDRDELLEELGLPE